MKKTKILIEMSGGTIQNITSTEDNVEIHILDYDESINEMRENVNKSYSPDRLIPEVALFNYIENRIEDQPINCTNGMDLSKYKEPDVYIKDEGDFIGVIMSTYEAKTIAMKSGYSNQYRNLPTDLYRFDTFVGKLHEIIKWCEANNLTYDSEI